MRGRSLRLTGSGDTLHDGVIVVALKRESLLLHGFDEQERTQLLSFIARLHANVALVNEGMETPQDAG